MNDYGLLWTCKQSAWFSSDYINDAAKVFVYFVVHIWLDNYFPLFPTCTSQWQANDYASLLLWRWALTLCSSASWWPVAGFDLFDLRLWGIFPGRESDLRVPTSLWCPGRIDAVMEELGLGSGHEVSCASRFTLNLCDPVCLEPWLALCSGFLSPEGLRTDVLQFTKHLFLAVFVALLGSERMIQWNYMMSVHLGPTHWILNG